MGFINKNIEKIEITGIRKFFNKVKDVEDAISMTIGQPDFPVPKAVKEEMINAINKDKSGYTKNEGIVELREEISKYLLNQKINYSIDEICITTGGSEAIFSSIKAILNEGETILVPDPAYPAYEGCIKMGGGKIKKYSLTEEFQPNFSEIEEILATEKNIKGIIISYPCNPTGSILSKESYNKLIEIFKSKDIVIISDEMYSSIIFEEEYYSVAQSKELADKIILIGGFSKIFSMTGLRVGYVCAKKEMLSKINVVHQHNVTCAPSIAQWGAVAGLKSSMNEVMQRNEEFKKRRDYICGRLKKMGIKVQVPKGAFYLFIDMRFTNIKSEELCDRLLYEQKVAMVPGSAFGEKGEGFVRLSYSYSMEELKEGLDRMEMWLNKNKLIKTN
ncbi:pyridoxal phosphate-dependent aminotransferase [Oceanirhabdus sp. W0125-5]|uniref:pyridoxal phosphate-dependent aminotransferase n=1 Tax=Oceanirhabdus sp. W0125-5 TaxID=2999116 RepID=UPI0022F2F082|nr:aminotransferase class I/II-fold pyridoxal phosphate-dependent enzyme [Oceanirhabdus sp. W0125-5]WBW99378.1 aminotransferase class I/II-fold pyridoxal phosphate-dependent enzyme [Oceanirhabdus sp. W0125-5]